MFFPKDPVTLFVLLSVSTLLWGGWMNMLKLTRGVRFEIFYINFVIGAVFTSIFIGFTLGSWEKFGIPFFSMIFEGHLNHILRAFLAGVLFNVANIFLVASAAFSGISFSILTCFGSALITDSIMRFFLLGFPKPILHTIGLALIIFSLISINLLLKRVPNRQVLAKKTFMLAVMSGILIGLFYPLLERSLDKAIIKDLGPYVSTFFFSLGLLACNIFITPIFMRKPIFGHPITLDNYTGSKKKFHVFGILAGAIWALGLSFKLIADTILPRVYIYSFLQLSILITFFFGILLWKEVPKGLNLYKFVVLSTFSYILGIICIGISKFA